MQSIANTTYAYSRRKSIGKSTTGASAAAAELDERDRADGEEDVAGVSSEGVFIDVALSAT